MSLITIPNLATMSSGRFYRSEARANVHIDAEGYLGRGTPNVYVDAGGTLYRSGQPMEIWRMGEGLTGYDWNCCVFNGKKFVALGSRPAGEGGFEVARAVSKENGKKWTVTVLGTHEWPAIKMVYDGSGNYAILSAPRFFDETLSVCGKTSRIYHSADDCSTLTQVLETSDRLTDICRGDGKFMAIGFSYDDSEYTYPPSFTPSKPRAGVVLLESASGASWRAADVTGLSCVNDHYCGEANVFPAPYIPTEDDKRAAARAPQIGSPYQAVIWWKDHYIALAGISVRDPGGASDMNDDIKYEGTFKYAESYDGHTWHEWLASEEEGSKLVNPAGTLAGTFRITLKSQGANASQYEKPWPENDWTYCPAFCRFEKTGEAEGELIYEYEGSYPYRKCAYLKAPNYWSNSELSLSGRTRIAFASWEPEYVFDYPYDTMAVISESGLIFPSKLHVQGSQDVLSLCYGHHVVVALGSRIRTDGNFSYRETVTDWIEWEEQ